MINVSFDTTPLGNENAHRGVGIYTKSLRTELKRIPDLEIVESKTVSNSVATVQKASLIHYPFFDLFFATLPIFKHTKTVVTIHDVIPLVFRRAYKVGIKGKISLLHQLIALRSVSAVITDSESSKSDIIHYLKVPAAKIHVIYLAANPNLKSASAEEITKIRHKFKLPEKYVLYVGDINYNKNLPELIKAISLVPDEVKLVLVGKNFYPHQILEWEAIELQLAISNVVERVIFIPQLDRDADRELSALYTGAVCYIQPSLYEGFGLPVVEALQCGAPVVATNTSSLTEVGGEAVTFVAPEAKAIAAGINQILLVTPAEKHEIITKGKKWAAQFSWTRTAHETAIVYREIVGQE